MRLKKLGLDQVGRATVGKHSSISIAKPKEVCFPFQFECHSLHAPAGMDDFYLDPEEIASILRRFKIEQDAFSLTGLR